MSNSPEKPVYGNGPAEIPQPAKVTVPRFRSAKGKRTLLCLTAYDSPTARLVDEAGFDLILVGDSMANVVLGHASTLKLSLDQIISATRAVKRAADRPLIVADMPFGTYHISIEDTLTNALRLIREGGAQAVKLEGGRNRAHLIRALVEADIPVMGHVGLLPQSINTEGGYRVQGKRVESARQVLADALAVEAAGAFAVVLEGIPAEVAQVVTEHLSIPTIGIGAGNGTDGQILVFHDVVGLSMGPAPKFVRRYANLANVIRNALGDLRADMLDKSFPSQNESYPLAEALPEGWDLDVETGLRREPEA
ncbi:MAG: 3-methyl-2-oxobutanoate hydroxymethyltransferase [Planctomycetes bacterium]|nr:3-methyl-2-oxobutanoate hydroxymethyltransferase [Planctomycetota bacterium]